MNLSERFAQAQGAPLEIDGEIVHAIFRRGVLPGQTFKLRVSSHVSFPVQGIRMRVGNGKLLINGREVVDLVLWTDTMPSSGEVEVTCIAPKAAELQVWNCWRDTNGVMQAWIGNAGMKFEERLPGQVIARCNSRPELTFSDITFEMYF